MSVFVNTLGSGPDLALLHGWGLNGAVWQNIRDALAENFTLHLIDLPGHGQSADVAATTLDEMSEAINKVLPDKTHLLGWSLGGQVAMNITLRYPQKIDKLVLVATTPQFVAGDDWPHGMKPGVLADFVSRLSTHYAATIKNFLTLQTLHPDQAEQPDNIRQTIQHLQKAVLAGGAPNLDNLKHGLNVLAETNLRPMAGCLTTPTLIIQGDHDALTPIAAARWLATAIPAAEYALIEHAAHAPFLSHRAAFIARIQAFLKS